MTRTGSARMRHSHRDQREGRRLANDRRGAELGNDARIYRFSKLVSSTGRLTGWSGGGEPNARPIWGVSVESGSLTVKTFDMSGSSRMVSDMGSGLVAISNTNSWGRDPNQDAIE